VKQLNITIKKLYDVFKEHPEVIGKVNVETRFGFYKINACEITAYNSDVMEVKTKTKTIKTSPEHLLYDSSLVWKKVNELTINDSLFTRDGLEKIVSIKKLSRKKDLYDIEVDDKHEFYANGFVSHNSSLMSSIHYALFGKAIGNSTNLGNLVNNINGKNMCVKLSFSKDDVNYQIIRGRSPNILKLLREGEDIISDDSQGDSRETQKEIERIIGFSDDLYNQLFNLSCKVPLFLSQTTANQKAILEQILGVDMISKKIILLKELIKDTKNAYNNEVFKYNTIKTQNENLETTITRQLSDLEAQKKSWKEGLEKSINDTKLALDQLSKIDVVKDLENFKLLDAYKQAEKENADNKALLESYTKEIDALQKQLDEASKQYSQLTSIDYAKEQAKFESNEAIKQKEIAYNQEKMIWENKKTQKANLDRQFKTISDSIAKKEKELASVQENLCPTCGQVLNAETAEAHKKEINEAIAEFKADLHKVDMELLVIIDEISNFQEQTFTYENTLFKSANDLANAMVACNSLQETVKNLGEKISDLNAKKNSIVIKDLGERPTTVYQTIEQVMEHQSNVKMLESYLVKYQETLLTNPFEAQERSIQELKNTLTVLDDTAVKAVENELLHQETLLKLLNSPSSFIRKTILDKSLEYLNSRIAVYLEKLGSMHAITFKNDMSIKISRMGIEYGYISSGEEGRVNIALTFAFRDVWESLNNCDVNVWFFDEVIDRLGLDEAGVKLFVSLINSKTNKNVLMVTHNSNLLAQATNVLTLVKENNFTKIL
jgi:DNA repair exonuclease SbcCD ATPase subunit